MHEHRLDKLALQAGLQCTALDRVLVHIKNTARSPNTTSFSQGFAHSEIIFVAQPHVPQCRGTSGRIPRSTTRTVKQGNTALSIPDRSDRGLGRGCGKYVNLATRAFLDERPIETKQASHSLMTEMTHKHCGLPIEVDGFAGALKEVVFACANKTQRLV